MDDLATLRRHGEPPQHEMALGLTYLRAIERPAACRSCCRRCRRVETLLDRLDGICLSGGPDLDPAAYGARPTRSSARPSPRSTASSSSSPAPPTPRAAAARRLPRRPGAQRRARRHAAPARRGPPPAALATEPDHAVRSRRARALARARDPRDAGQLLPPPGRRRARRGPRRLRRGRTTAPSRRSRTAASRSSSACSGTPRRCRPGAAGALPRPGRGRDRTARCSVTLAARAVSAIRLRGVVKRYGPITAVDRPRPRGARGHLRRAARPERRRQVDDDAAADGAGDRRRGRDRGARVQAARGDSKPARARVRRRAAARQPRHHAHRRAEPARLRAPVPDRRAPSGRAAIERALEIAKLADRRDTRSTSSRAACAGGC